MIMRMMKNNRNETIMVIGIDHGYGNMKTATRCFPSGVARYDKEPIFQNNLLKEGGLLVLEHGKDNNFEENPHFLERRVYGSVNFSLFR